MPLVFASAILAASGGPQERTAPQALDPSTWGASITTRSVVLVAVAITTVAVAVATARAVATRWALRRRVAYALWPTDTFDPQPEEIVRVAAQLSRTRLAVFGVLVRRATAIRIRLQSTDDGELLYVLEGPARARSLLRSLGFDEVEVRSYEPAEPEDQAQPDPKSEAEPTPRRRLHKARAELELALSDTQPLREVPLRPDPLTPFAHAMGELRADLGESASVVIDLMPVAQAVRRRMVRRTIAAERTADGTSTSSTFWDQVKVGLGESNGRSRPATPRRPHALSLEGAERRAEHRGVSTKLVGHDPAFHIQVLVRTASAVRGRPEAHLRSLLSAFDIFGGQNYLRARGQRIGPWFLGADTPGRRLWFDRRLDGGLFGPGKRTVVTARELLGLLKPPTLHCRPMNVARSGGMVPPPPRGLPEFRYQHDVLPLGTVQSHDGERPVGTWVRDINFAYMSGRAGYGKALALDTPVPTAGGWTTMGEIRTGDVVFDERGEPCRVVGRSEVMVDHACYEVVFSDGSTVVADGEHLWRTWSYRARRSAAERVRRWGEVNPPPARNVAFHRPSGRWHAVARREGRVHSLGYFDVEEAALEAARRFRHAHPLPGPAGPALISTADMARSLRHGDRANHAIEVAGPLECPERELAVDPYVLGAWLGDGTTANGGITCADTGIVEEIRAAGFEVRKWGDQGGSRPYAWGVVGLMPELRTLGVLGHKRIPLAYQRASVKQRTALLEGLMDTDGSCSKAGQCEFSSVSHELAGDVYELVCGLGIKATLSSGRARLEGRDCGERHRVTFTPTTAVFRLARKLERQRVGSVRSTPRWRYVVTVRPVASVPVRCIAVDSPSHLYLAGRACIPTHNTETAINQFIHLARAGHGCFFLDPHEDALARIKPYLSDVADRVVEVNLAAARSRGRQAGWNLFSMEGLAAEHIEARVSAVADSFGSVLRWSEQNNRALSITTRAAESLCHLALLLPPEKAPTIFQISTLLSNDDWRKGVVGFLPPTVRDYWENRYPRLASDASTAVSNLVDRLSSSAAVSALLGSSQSTYRIRQCMDEGKIVLACPAGVGDKDRLVAGFLVFDLLQAALSRKDTPAKDRRPFYCWFDEVQTYDGASRGNLAALLEQARKYRVVAFLLNQNPDRLTEATYDAVTTNTSLLATTVVNAEAAVKLANQWGKAVDPKTITRLDKYTYLASVTIGTELSRPFRVKGFEVGQLWAEHHHPEKVAELEKTVDTTMNRRPLAEAIRHLEGLDEAILEHLQSLRGRTRLHVVGEEDDGQAPALAGGPRRRSDRVRWSDLET